MTSFNTPTHPFIPAAEEYDNANLKLAALNAKEFARIFGLARESFEECPEVGTSEGISIGIGVEVTFSVNLCHIRHRVRRSGVQGRRCGRLPRI